MHRDSTSNTHLRRITNAIVCWFIRQSANVLRTRISVSVLSYHAIFRQFIAGIMQCGMLTGNQPSR